MTRPIFEYNSNWEIHTLEKNQKEEIILDTSQGSDPSSKDPDSWNGTIPFLTPKDITGRFTPIYVSAAERYVTKKGASQSGGIQKANSVMLTIRAPVGSVVINKIPIAANRGFLGFQCGPKLLPEFLYFWFRANKPYLERIANGSIFDALAKYDLFELKIGIPKIKEQEKIIHFLKLLEDEIQHLITLNKLLDNFQKNIFNKLFPSIFDDELFGSKTLIKKEMLGEVCSLVTDGAHQSPKEFLDGTKRIATVKNMRKFDIDIKNCKIISDNDYSQLVKNNCKPEKYDILISKDGTMGITHLFNGQNNLVLLSSIALLRVKDSFSCYYLKNYLGHEIIQSHLIGGFSTGSALNRIILDDLKKIEVLYPPDELKIKFDKIAKPINEIIFVNMEKINLLKSYFDSVLPKLIYGTNLLL